MFSTLLQAIPDKNVAWDGADFPVTGIAYDSRKIKQGFLFVAIQGGVSDGHSFINNAVETGASGIVCQKAPVGKFKIPVVVVPDTREVLALISAQFYGKPAQHLNLIGVTGTNGKTTVTYLLDEIYRSAGQKTGIIGTIGYKIGNNFQTATHTTPESLELQALFSEMAVNNVKTVLMEISSHAISQKRVHGTPFDIAIFTNLSHDHLDFHGTMERYWEIKASFFYSLSETQKHGKKPIAIINIDDSKGKELITSLKIPCLSYGTSPNADLYASDIKLKYNHTTFKVTWKGKEKVVLQIKLLGLFNVYNSLAAISTALVQGFSLKQIAGILKNAHPVPGRFESINCGQPFTVIVDYAHTPDGLANLLQSVRDIAKRKVITVFGCGGDRDRGKRPKMGYEAAKFSDIIIVTSDNPRSEEPTAIINEILPGIEKNRVFNKGKQVFIEPDREKGIQLAFKKACPDDIVVIAGKGHEVYQVFKDKTIPFDDRKIVSKFLMQNSTLNLTIQEVAKIINGTIVKENPDITITSISTDTRTLNRGALYIPLKGEKFEGHDFLEKASKKDASAVIVKKGFSNLCPKKISCIEAEEPLVAYMQLAKSHRQKFNIPIVAVTGSNGKTTTKEMISSLLGKNFFVLSSQENFNNEVGVPKTLLKLTDKHSCVVLELAMRGKGQIKELAEISLPTIGIITNIGEAHLEMLGSREAIMHAKGELLESLPQNGIAILPAQDIWVKQLASKCRCKIIYYAAFPYSVSSYNHNNIAYIVNLISANKKGSVIQLISPQGAKECSVHFIGEHNLRNAAGAMAVALELGVSLDDIALAFSTFNGAPHRLKTCERKDGVLILDDTYNASPASMREAIKTLADFPGARRRLAFLADMLELGGEGPELHREIGRVAANSGIDYLITCGSLAEEFAKGAMESGMSDNKIKSVTCFNEGIKVLPDLQEGDVILIKGSRKMGMENLVELLLKDEKG